MGERKRVPSKRLFSSPERRFTGALVYSILGTCFYHKAWNFIPNIFTEHLLHACHESSEFASRGWKSGPFALNCVVSLMGINLSYTVQKAKFANIEGLSSCLQYSFNDDLTQLQALSTYLEFSRKQVVS